MLSVSEDRSVSVSIVFSKPEMARPVDILKTNLHVRSAHTSTLVGSYLFIQGGYDGSDHTSELLTFNLRAFHITLSILYKSNLYF